MFQSKSILLVEDNPIVQKYTRQCFERHGCQVTVAGTKKSAIRFSQTTRFDLILMDIGLPDGSGWEVIETTRDDEQSQNPTTPIVILSAHINAEQEREKCQIWQVNRIIEKPLKFEETPKILNIIDGINL